jgi:hypothetical protein
MRTLLIVMVLAASVEAAPAQDAPMHAPSLGVDVTELTVTGGGGVQTMVLHDALSTLDDVTLRCYANAQAQAPRLAGTIALRFRIDAKGTATNIAVTGVPSVSACLIAAIKAASFAGPSKGPIEIREKVNLRILYAMSGILGSTGSTQGGAFVSLTGTGDLSSGLADDYLLHDGLVGTDAGLQGKAATPMLSTGQLRVQGELDKSTIRRYIRRNFQKLQSCYEKRLLAVPGLAGTVTAKFTIDVNGKVTESTASGMADGEVNTCIASVISNIEFPKPKAGNVVVSYPFIFRPGDDKSP